MEIIYFARIREDIGFSSEYLSLPENISNVSALLDYLEKRGQNYKAAFGNRAIIRAAVNQVCVTGDYPLQDGDKVAFFPPMTGG